MKVHDASPERFGTKGCLQKKASYEPRMGSLKVEDL